MNIGFLVGLVTSVVLARWVLGDAKEREALGMKVAPFGPTGCAVAVFLIWIIFVPWYLIARSRTTAPPPAA